MADKFRWFFSPKSCKKRECTANYRVKMDKNCTMFKGVARVDGPRK